MCRNGDGEGARFLVSGESDLGNLIERSVFQSSCPRAVSLAITECVSKQVGLFSSSSPTEDCSETGCGDGHRLVSGNGIIIC